MICIIDYDTGNIGSIGNMLSRLGIPNIISQRKEDIMNAEKLILPGVGAFDEGMNNLHKFEIVSLLQEKVLTQKTPILGICLGAQLLGNKSEEGSTKGLSFIDMDVIKFQSKSPIERIPNIGWFDISSRDDSRLFDEIQDPRFYFVHSYYFSLKSNADCIATNSFFGFEYACAFKNDNVMGVQFHPEKSHKYGMCLLKNFATQF